MGTPEVPSCHHHPWNPLGPRMTWGSPVIRRGEVHPRVGSPPPLVLPRIHVGPWPPSCPTGPSCWLLDPPTSTGRCPPNWPLGTCECWGHLARMGNWFPTSLGLTALGEQVLSVMGALEPQGRPCAPSAACDSVFPLSLPCQSWVFGGAAGIEELIGAVSWSHCPPALKVTGVGLNWAVGW